MRSNLYFSIYRYTTFYRFLTIINFLNGVLNKFNVTKRSYDQFFNKFIKNQVIFHLTGPLTLLKKSSIH